MNSVSSNEIDTSSASQLRLCLHDKLLRQALVAGERYQMQFSQVSALAQAIAKGETSSQCSALASLLCEVASDAELSAALDVELFRGLMAGRLLSRQIGYPRASALDDFSSSRKTSQRPNGVGAVRRSRG